MSFGLKSLSMIDNEMFPFRNQHGITTYSKQSLELLGVMPAFGEPFLVGSFIDKKSPTITVTRFFSETQSDER